VTAPRWVRRGAPALAAVALLTSGCAANSTHARPGAISPSGTIAMLPLENLSGRAENGDRFTRLVWSAVGRSGRFQLVDPGEVDAVLVELRIRSAGSLTREQVLKAAGRLHARWLLAGTLLECGTVHAPDGDVPSFTLTLRLLDGESGRVVWTDLRARSGEDHETVFGWGRESSLERLAEATTQDLLKNLRVPATPDTLEGR